MPMMETVWMWVRISVVLMLAIAALKSFGPTTEKTPSPKEDTKDPDNENWLKFVQAAIDLSRMACEMKHADRAGVDGCLKRSAAFMMESMTRHNVEMERQLKAAKDLKHGVKSYFEKTNVEIRKVDKAIEMLRRVVERTEHRTMIDLTLFDEYTQHYGAGVSEDQPPLNGSQTEIDGLHQSSRATPADEPGGAEPRLCRMAEAPSHEGSPHSPTTVPPVKMSESAQPTSKCRRVACDPVGVPMSGGDASQP